MIAIIGALALSAAVAQETNEPPVKKSQANICHERGTNFYKQTAHFESFPTLQACLASGGRKPASQPVTEQPSKVWWRSWNVVEYVVATFGLCGVVAGIVWMRGRYYLWLDRRRLKQNEIEARRKWDQHRRE